ncbi:MCP four helix bundle domain-containing protein [Pseudomonas sp. DNDY-54]|uniref:MCP four helix bundle domain-containing protein n=1 Tax=Pseudomonas sp. DNDY-54 TaxID=2870860 RepID=UPI003917DD93
MSIRNMSVSIRSAAGFGLIGLIVLVLGLFSLNQMAEMREESSQVDQNWLPSIVSLGDLNASMLRIRALTMRLMLVDGEAISATDQSLTKLVGEIGTLNSAYEKRITIPEEKAA